MNARYDGKPFVRLLDSYVLWCIDQLDDQTAQNLEGLTPNLQAAYQKNGSWQQIMEELMELEGDTPAHQGAL